MKPFKLPSIAGRPIWRLSLGSRLSTRSLGQVNGRWRSHSGSHRSDYTSHPSLAARTPEGTRAETFIGAYAPAAMLCGSTFTPGPMVELMAIRLMYVPLAPVGLAFWTASISARMFPAI